MRQHTASLPPQVSYCAGMPELPQQSPPSQPHAQLLLGLLHLPFRMVCMVVLRHVGPQLASSKVEWGWNCVVVLVPRVVRSGTDCRVTVVVVRSARVDRVVVARSRPSGDGLRLCVVGGERVSSRSLVVVPLPEENLGSWQHTASLPPHVEYCVLDPESPQQSPPSQSQAQLLLTELHFLLPTVAKLPCASTHDGRQLVASLNAGIKASAATVSNARHIVACAGARSHA